MSISKEQFISDYLERINYQGDLALCSETLIELQQLHVYHIPFENLDLLGDSFTPNLDREFLFDKIVTRRRGGVCYELNTSFFNLLTAIGFSTHQISGAVQPGENMFSHVATLVHLPEGDFIADVGFGDSYLPVLSTASDKITQVNDLEYRLVYSENQVADIQRRRPNGEWERMYTICFTPRVMDDYFDRFHWASAKGNTAFSMRPICVSHTSEQRITLRRGVLSIERGGKTVESFPVVSEEETKRVLREYFDLP